MLPQVKRRLREIQIYDVSDAVEHPFRVNLKSAEPIAEAELVDALRTVA